MMGVSKINKTLRKFYILGVVLMLLIISGLILQYSILNDGIKKNKENYIDRSLEALRQEITSELKTHSQVIGSLTELIKANTWSDQELEAFLKSLMKVDKDFSALYYGDIDNKMINSIDWVPPEDYDLRTRPWYEKAKREQERIYSEAYLDAVSKKIIITISQPVYDHNNKLMGVASGDIHMEHIIRFIEEVKSSTIGYSFLIDGEGHILAHPEYGYDDYSELRKIDEISGELLDEMKVTGTGRIKIILDGVDGYLFYQGVEDKDWIVGSFISLEQYNENDYPVWNMFVIVLVIAIVIFGGFLLIQSKYIIRPLTLLEKDIEAINIENKIDYRLDLKISDPFIKTRGFINTALKNTEKFFYQQKEYQEELLASHEELEASYGQLSAMEQALREQLEELEIREDKLYHLSHYDQLTGLANRRFFELEFERLNNKKHFPLALIMADVNGLKLINDSFGHVSGDELLKNIGLAMKTNCGENQHVSRIGGDEFIILLPRTDVREAEEIIKRIRTAVMDSNIHNIDVSVSFGIGIKSSEEENISDILKKAEDQMYSNKLVEGPSMRSRTIDTIIQALYEKNPREEAHSSRVSELCKQMGIHLGMTEEKIREIEKVGLLHDIGKVAISDTVLEKPGSLTKEEFEEIKKHPEIGYRILGTINEMSQIAEYVLAHHERCDGTGYPKGLKCDEIPLVAKIIAIADAYDAMVSDRPYRKGLPEEVAIGEIIKNAGTQFDPELAKIFVEKVLEKEWIKEDKV